MNSAPRTADHPHTSPNQHPPGLRILFFAEMWERFSYYGMRALLVLYLVNALGYARADALQVYATYTALVYITPILGGYLADRWLGCRRAVLIGGAIMALGHFAMAVPSLLYPALALLIIGNGFFKPNISTMVGRLYEEQDPRRDGGYTIFYMGINLGGFLAPLVCGYLGEEHGWHYGFAAAGVGMVLGLITFWYGQHRLGSVGLPPRRRDHTTPPPTPLSASDRRNLLALAIMSFFIVFFWMGFEQAGGTMNLFADQQTDRHLLGWEIPASYFQSINPLVIILFAPLFSYLWTRIDRSGYALSPVVKQAIGMIILGLGFVVLAIAQERAQQFGQVGPGWLIAVYFLHTMGELCLSPIGLSMVSTLAPQRMASLCMGLWFTAIAIANYLAGTLESLLQQTGIPLFWFLVSSSVGAGVLLWLMAPRLQRLMTKEQ